ncbi:hypothetical protein V9K81_08270 [Pseudomonas monteilii]|uniref:hypothetical protein n=1 Tax=Pseudomonas monteilii TaxID=76759 RepID=UPI0030D3B803
MAFYHIAFIACGVVQGHPMTCQPEQMVDTKYSGLVSCHSTAKGLEQQIIREFLQEAKSQGDATARVEVKTRCLSADEGEEFIKKNGASALFVTGKEFD